MHICIMSKMDENIQIKTNSLLHSKLKEICTSKSYEADEVIVNENAYIKAIPIVTKGSIRVMRTEPDGREILLYYIKAGETCVMSFLGGLHDDFSKVKAITEEPTEIQFVPMDKVSVLIKEFPEWLDYIFKLYHKRFEELLEVVNEIAFQKMDERLLNFLKRKSALSESKIISLTHEQIANELGTARVVVSRLLKQLEELNVVKLSRNRIEMLV